MISYSKLAVERDRDEYRELFRAVFAKEMSEELFAWKYLANPHQVDREHCLIFVARDGDQLVGARSLFPGRVFYRGACYAGAQGGDTMVLPSHRGRGIFSALLELSVAELGARGLNVLYNFPNRNSLRGNLSQGARLTKKMYTGVRLLDAGKARRREIHKLLPAPDLPVRGELPAPRGYALTLGLFADPQVDELFLQDFTGVGLVAQDRTSAQLNWRFGQYPNPHKTYRFIHLWQDQVLLGYAVLALSGNGVGEIADYLVRGHSPGHFTRLLGGALSWFRRHGATHAKVWYAYPGHRGVLALRGFIPKRLNISFVTRFLAPAPFEQAPWYLSMGDTDTF